MPVYRIADKTRTQPGEGGGRVGLGLMGMCRWMGSPYDDWRDYNGVAFSIGLLESHRKFWAVWCK